jgi:aminopeptidase N
MFAKVAGFEFRYQLRQPLFWIIVAIFGLIAFLFVALQDLSVGGVGANDHRNGPYAIGMYSVVLSLFYMFVTTAFVANVIVRDDETGYGPIIRTTRLAKTDYLFGRFTGAFAAAALSFAVVPLAIVLGSFAPWVDRETLGPIDLGALTYAYLVLALPNILFTSALFFCVATLTRSLMWTYVGVIVLLVLWFMSSIIFDKPQFEQPSALLEPFGAVAYGVVTKYWTANERNSMSPALQGVLLYNRLIIAGASMAFLALAHVLFRFQDAERSGRKVRRARRLEAAAPPPARASILAPRPGPRFDRFTAVTQMLARTRLDFGQVFGHPAFWVILAVGLFNGGGGMYFTTQETRYGGAIHPVASVLIRALFSSFTFIPIIMAVFFAGDLVWRERDKRTHEIVDASPLPDWAFVLPKALALSLALVSVLVVSVLAALLIQASQGYDRSDLGQFFVWYMLPQAAEWIMLAVLAIFLNVVTPHKFVAWGLMVLLIASRQMLPAEGFDDFLYHFGWAPNPPLSDMNGLGKFWIGAWWFRFYWSAFCVVLMVLGYALWRRGTETRLMPRLRRLPRRLWSRAGVVASLGLAVFAVSGAFIFINTHVWNHYRSSLDDERWQAEQEQTLKPFEGLPQPKIMAVKLDLDLEPHKPRLTARGVYTIENKTGQPLREVHVFFANRDLKVLALSIEGAGPKATFARFNYRIFRFYTPMAPGETRTMSFVTEISQRGFRNSGDLRGVVDNGTFLNNTEFAPMLGVTRQGWLNTRVLRRKYHLQPEDLHLPPPTAPGVTDVNYLRHDSDWVSTDITVTTVADQTPIAPGNLIFDRVDGGHRTARFVSDRPILNFYSVQSARYAEKHADYKGVRLGVYYDPKDAWNVDRMIQAQKLTLDYAQANFSPYQFRQIRFLQFPNYAQYAQAFAGTVPWSEGLFFIADYRDPEKIDMVTYVGAHEIGHQWWAHQLIGADAQGAAALTESLAQYTALMVMRRTYGPDMVQKFLKFEADRYLRGRGTDPVGEQALGRVEGQDYVSYRKGSLVMYRLADELGEDKVNAALRSLLARYAYKGAPYPTAIDLENALKAVAPAGKQALISDLFDRITLYDLKTTAMKVSRRPDGRYDVALTVEARKVYADPKGKETPAPLDEALPVGLFLAQPGKKDFNAGMVLVLEKRPIHSGRQVLAFVTGKAPVWGGVDPYNMVIDRNPDDNLFRRP